MRHAFHKHQPLSCCLTRPCWSIDPISFMSSPVCGLHQPTIEPMLPACSQGDLKRMGRLMKAGADVNVGDYDKRRPLHIAAAEINLPAVRAVDANIVLFS